MKKMRKCLFLTKSDMLLGKGKANDNVCISAIYLNTSTAKIAFSVSENKNVL